MRRLIVFIENPRLFMRLIGRLRFLGVDFIVPTEPKPPKNLEGDILLTDMDIEAKGGVVVRIGKDGLDEALSRALCAVKGRDKYSEVLVGIDPGEPVAYVVLGDGEVLDQGKGEPEEVVEKLWEVLARIPHVKAVIRIGDSGPNIDRIVEELARRTPIPARIELIDEHRTSRRRSPRRSFKDRDIEAAYNIAFRNGVEVLIGDED